MKYGAIILAALLLAGCGGNSSSGYGSAKEVARAAGCEQVKVAPPAEVTLFATDEVECKAAGQFTLVDWFKDGDSLDNFRQASKGSGSYLLVGDNWAVQCASKALCEAMKAKVGGSIE